MQRQTQRGMHLHFQDWYIISLEITSTMLFRWFLQGIALTIYALYLQFTDCKWRGTGILKTFLLLYVIHLLHFPTKLCKKPKPQNKKNPPNQIRTTK